MWILYLFYIFQADIYRKIDETCVDVCDLLLRFVKKIVLLSAELGGEEHNRHQLRHGQRIADVGKRTSTDIQPTSFTHSRELDWQLLDLWKKLKKLPHLTPGTYFIWKLTAFLIYLIIIFIHSNMKYDTLTVKGKHYVSCIEEKITSLNGIRLRLYRFWFHGVKFS